MRTVFAGLHHAYIWPVLVALGLLIGLLVGCAVGAAVAGPRRARRNQAEPEIVPSAAHIPPEVMDVLSALRSIFVVVDASDRVVRSSPNAQALGVVRGTELTHPQLRALVRQVRRDEDVREVDLDVARGPLGQGQLSINVRVALLGEAHVVALIEDLTHSRRVEEIRRDFVVNVSHELKTPVAGLTLLAEAMDDAREDPAAVHRFAGRMTSETGRLSRLVQEIVELSRLQVADTLDEPVLVDVRASTSEAISHLATLAEDKQIDITESFGNPGRSAQVYGDANLLTTAIRNLVENAINYSEPGTRVAVTVQPDSDLVTIVVKDQGAGIPPADQERVFERFYRVDAARSRRTGGTGLGLAIVKHVCANHGGEVSVWSEEGQGSTFTIRLPAADLAASTPVIPTTVPLGKVSS